MKILRLLIILLALTTVVWIKPTRCDAQGTWQTRLAQRVVPAVSGIQKFCIEKGKVECEVIEIDQNPPLLQQGQVIGYVGIRQAEFLYFYLVVAESDDMITEIYLFDSQNRLLGSGVEVRGGNFVVHKPEYTQKVFARIRMFKGSGHICRVVLAPVGSD